AVLSRTRVSRVVDELAAAGLAERQPDQADGRSSFAVLTPAGRNALRRAWPVYRQAIRRPVRKGGPLAPPERSWPAPARGASRRCSTVNHQDPVMASYLAGGKPGLV